MRFKKKLRNLKFTFKASIHQGSGEVLDLENPGKKSTTNPLSPTKALAKGS